MGKERKKSKRIIGLVLCLTIFLTQGHLVFAFTPGPEEGMTASASISPQPDDTGDISVSDVTDIPDVTDTSEEPGSTSESVIPPEPELSSESETPMESEPLPDAEPLPDYAAEEKLGREDITPYYQDGRICIYNYGQLLLIGSGQAVFSGDKDGDIGSGEEIKVEGEPLAYGADCQYYLMNDMEMDSDNPWRFPQDFTGTLTSYEERESTSLYDSDINTIYIYNRYQLELICSENSENEYVMSEDMNPETVGMGQVFPLADGSYLTYGSSHRYVIASDFTAEVPELMAAAEMTTLSTDSHDSLSGRDYVGQVTKTIDGTQYILIGNEQQLRAIGSGKKVNQRIIKRTTGIGGGKETLEYTGDADLSPQESLSDKTYNAVLLYDYYIYNEKGELVKNNSPNTGLTYSSTANYIIFRDIDLNNEQWTPLMFSGTMIGAKAGDTGKIWTDGGSAIAAQEQPVISNVMVNQTGAIDNTKQIGIGFFGSITSQSTNSIGMSDRQVLVKNIKLSSVQVTNTSTTIKDNTGLISGILGVLGNLLEWLTGPLGKILNILLNPGTNTDETVFATGSFAGKIYGDVLIEDCAVENLITVSNSSDLTGGFAGSAEGMVQYGKLQEGLGQTIRVLKEVLNVLPFLDLGTLIEVLLDGNIIDVDKLIPTGYYNPEIVNCSVTTSNLTIGSDTTSYNGGFVGRQIGTRIKNSGVTASGTLTVEGKSFAGGFAGLAANAELKGVLSDLGVDLMGSGGILINSMVLGCSVQTVNLSVTAAEDYGGGLTGALANSYAVDSSVSGTCDVQAGKNYAGGITGRATLAQSISLGDYTEAQNSLTTLLGNLLSGITSGDKANSLLSLTGVSPSMIAGCTISNGLDVTAASDYAGI